jgi:ABC-type branched-subunit amino acid transport system permease subunit
LGRAEPERLPALAAELVHAKVAIIVVTEYYLIPVGIIFTALVMFMPQGRLGFAKRRLHQ